MQIRSFSTFAAAAFAALVLALAGCKTMEVNQRNVVDALAGVAGAVVCYKNVGGGQMRVISGAACGVGAVMLADWLQKGSQTKDAERMANEYQRALSDFSRTNLDNVAYPDIVTTTKEGQVRISLAVNHLESYPPATQCRGFSELTTLNGTPYAPQGVRPGWVQRRACRDREGNAWTPWRIFTN